MSLPKHVGNYLKAFGYDSSDTILCEWCNAVGVEIHHVEPRSMFGSKRKEEQDKPENLVCLCRKCHEMAHGDFSREMKIRLKELVNRRVKPVIKLTFTSLKITRKCFYGF